MSTIVRTKAVPVTAALLLCACLSTCLQAPALADSPWLYGIHWFGPQSNASDINEMAGGKPLWILETVMTNDGWGQWGPEGQLANFQNTVNLGHTLIMRVQPVWGKAIPLPTDTDPSIAEFLDQVSHTADLYKNVCHVWHLGNEMNLDIEWAGQQLSPEAYIDAAAQFSDRIKAVSSSLGPQIVLVGPLSPGGVAGERWMSSTEYLSRMCDHIDAMGYRDRFDGFALHAYGTPWTQDLNAILTSFESTAGEGYQYHIDLLDSKGFTNWPIYITEWNRYTGAGNGPEEYASARFLHNAFARMHTWNESHHRIVCACWFIYPNDPAWSNYSLLGLKNTDTYDRDVWHAFQYACSLNLPAGTGARTSAGFYQAGWNLTSVPVEPFAPEASTAFQDLVAVGNTISGDLYRYDSGVGYAIYPGTFTNIARGRGYWLRLTTAPPGTVLSVVGREALADVSLTLSQGWNLIGHPHPQAAALSACQVKSGTSTVTFNAAVVAGWVTGTLYYWDSAGGYQVLNTAGYGGDTSLRPWRGYWIRANLAGLSLVVPKPT